MRSNAFLSRGEFIRQATSAGWTLFWYRVSTNYINIAIQAENAVTTVVPALIDTEHVLDIRAKPSSFPAQHIVLAQYLLLTTDILQVQVLIQFFKACVTGRAPAGTSMPFQITAA
jgi:hypothetical protein